MNEKLYDVNFSYTLDYVSWTCPKCGNFVEKSGADIFDLDCDECGFEREECSLDNDNVTSESETLSYSEEEEE